MVPQGKHFMEMAVYEGQRCQKATGKISFLDPSTMSYQLHTLSACCVTLGAWIIYMCLFMVMQMHKIKGGGGL